ncbi:permease [Candidatus Kaiserbacteria bacterium CG10_big_fil_rev_8_21_14_0_10_56_12]|uniref:Permease n=1 Tax=Candidatus Kaiserbacteria bacterium CG10_big_fil_rev_8_21_14_0_10_56_12 TaxID=1974611 RepID=A0A2H0UAF5_9BACT|nr:MAG: permease [Candidatus Kaiserbacteria bacterium CG10_big_fil_rev_8_21_14_0_10_56_12]
MIILLALAAFLATLVGGLFALYLKDRLHLILGFSAGAILGVAFFDLMPEALDLAGSAYSVSGVMTVVMVGFVSYLVLDRMILLHSHSPGDGHNHRGVVGAASLSFHSFLDGAAIGLAFQVSPAVGTIVTAAVLTHDFSDGINTVSLILKNGGVRREAFTWLLVDALAPVLGVLSTLLFVVPAEELGLLLGLFAGFFLYIGASDLIPESHHAHPVRWTTVMTVLGIATLYVIIKLASI